MKDLPSTPHSAGARLAVVTPSYHPDFELCVDLNRTVLDMTGADVRHHIIVPGQDLREFSSLAGSRTIVHDARDFLPASFHKLPRLNVWWNASRPWPPVRGWIAQQVIKLSAVASLREECALLLDSDSELIRPVGAGTFMSGGDVVMYRKPGGVDSSLPGHRLWHVSGRALLGLTPPPQGDLTDYICWPCVWEPQVVRDMLAHVQGAAGRPWSTAVASQLHFSEMMLYGLYADEVRGGTNAVTNEMQGIVYSEERPLDYAEISQLLHAGSHDAVAVMLSAKARIPVATRRRALADFRASLATTDKGAEQ
ncbi:MAG TPA: DUF6492 family protein [Paenarthrobacter sp.]|nr:DUF6492 family protein [Paenarthrobacter sp.]